MLSLIGSGGGLPSRVSRALMIWSIIATMPFVESQDFRFVWSPESRRKTGRGGLLGWLRQQLPSSGPFNFTYSGGLRWHLASRQILGCPPAAGAASSKTKSQALIKLAAGTGSITAQSSVTHRQQSRGDGENKFRQI